MLYFKKERGKDGGEGGSEIVYRLITFLVRHPGNNLGEHLII